MTDYLTLLDAKLHEPNKVYNYTFDQPDCWVSVHARCISEGDMRLNGTRLGLPDGEVRELCFVCGLAVLEHP